MKPNRLQLLTNDENKKVIDAALQILSEIGVLVTLPEAVHLIIGAGGKKQRDGRICLDPERMRNLTDKAPRCFKLHDRRNGALEIGPNRSWTMCGGTVPKVLDWPTNTLRPATRDDVAQFARLCDALPQVHCVVPVVEAQDVKPENAEVISFAETLAYTRKFVLACPVKHESAKAWVEMGRIATDSKDLRVEPKVGLLATVLPNLHLDDDCASTTILAASEGLPLVCMTGAIAGSTGPNTIASSVAFKLAGELFQAVLAQIVRPGTPVLLDCGTTILDMNTTDLGEAGPEYGLGAAAIAQAAETFGLPTYSCALHSEAKQADFQAGLEKIAGMMSALLAGIDMTTNMGMLSRCSVASYEQMVLDDELCAFLQRFGKGLAVNNDTLAMDVIRDVGPGGDYVSHPHTAQHCRSGEVWYPHILDRSSVGARHVPLADRAHAKVLRILEIHDAGADTEMQKELMRCAENNCI